MMAMLAAAGLAALVAPDARAQGAGLPDPAGLRLVMVEEAGCVWCARWDEEIAPAYPRSAEGRRAPLLRMPIAEAPEPGYVFDAPVVYTPTFVLTLDGREQGRIEGYPGPDFFWGLLDALLADLPAAAGTAPAAVQETSAQGRPPAAAPGPLANGLN